MKGYRGEREVDTVLTPRLTRRAVSCYDAIGTTLNAAQHHVGAELAHTWVGAGDGPSRKLGVKAIPYLLQAFTTTGIDRVGKEQ